MGMRHINFDLSLGFDTPVERWRSEQLLLYKMTILTLRNFWFLLDNPDFPHLYDSGMVYLLPEQLENRPTQSQIDDLDSFLAKRMHMGPRERQHHLDLARGVEIFRDAPRMRENGGGDCDNLCCLRAAEIAVAAYRIGGRSGVKPWLLSRQSGSQTIYHAIVRHSDGSDEDPSIIMGMGGEDRRADRWEECRKNWERYDNMWQIAKKIMADETAQGVFKADYDRIARANELKAACDSFGYLPKDGKFRVGQPKSQTVLGHIYSEFPKMRGIDLLGASRTPMVDCLERGRRFAETGVVGHGGHYIERCSCGKVIGQCRCPSKNKEQRVVENGCDDCKRMLVGHGGHHGGRHHGGGFHQNWGLYPPTTFIVEDDTPDLYVTDYEYDVVSAANAPTATIVPARRVA
jgi:hypothetical protein